MMQLQKSNKVSKLNFLSLSGVKNREEVIYPKVLSDELVINNRSVNSEANIYNISVHSVSLEDYVEKHESIRNYLAGKKLRGNKLTNMELLVLERLNDKLDELLDSAESEFQKKTEDLLAEANRIIFRSGLKIGKG